jgi:hypothetical protein
MHRLGQKLLQLGVLVFQRLQALGIRHIEAAVLGLPLVERGAADPVFAANIAALRASFLFQNPDDLLFREPARLHVHPLSGDGLYPFLEEVAGLRSDAALPTRLLGRLRGALYESEARARSCRATGRASRSSLSAGSLYGKAAFVEIILKIISQFAVFRRRSSTRRSLFWVPD